MQTKIFETLLDFLMLSAESHQRAPPSNYTIALREYYRLCAPDAEAAGQCGCQMWTARTPTDFKAVYDASQLGDVNNGVDRTLPVSAQAAVLVPVPAQAAALVQVPTLAAVLVPVSAQAAVLGPVSAQAAVLVPMLVPVASTWPGILSRRG